MAHQLSEKNRQMAQELDRVFMMRKQKEAETQQVYIYLTCTYYINIFETYSHNLFVIVGGSNRSVL
jgi:hypothetical protein